MNLLYKLMKQATHYLNNFRRKPAIPNMIGFSLLTYTRPSFMQQTLVRPFFLIRLLINQVILLKILSGIG